jgi:hypothetical protein
MSRLVKNDGNFIVAPMKEYECCFCKKTFSGYGHNPEPLKDGIVNRCCDKCNVSKVIPARVDGYHGY